MAKPANWDKMTDKKKDEVARKLQLSGRAFILVAEALTRTIASMKAERSPASCYIEDMEMISERLYKNLVPTYPSCRQAEAWQPVTITSGPMGLRLKPKKVS